MSDQTTVAEQPAAPEKDPVLAQVEERFGEKLLESSVVLDQPTFAVRREDLIALATFLRDTAGLQFVRLSDLCGIDYLDLGKTPRFAVVYHFHSFQLNRWLRVRVPVDEDDAVVPTLTNEWSGANWFEREVYDLFGIEFSGHPDLTRILMPDEWEGHPLRKDFQPPKEPHEWSFNPEEWQKAVQRGS